MEQKRGKSKKGSSRGGAEENARMTKGRKKKKKAPVEIGPGASPGRKIGVARHRRKRRKEESHERDQTTWSKLFNNLILRGYLFVVTFPFGMQTSEASI